MTRQFWLFMLEEDEALLRAEIESVQPGLLWVPGRFATSGDPQQLLAEAPAPLTTVQLSARETRRLLFHRQASRAVVDHAIADGPFAGGRTIDPSLSECLDLARPAVLRGMLEPAKLMGETHVMRGDKKVRKSPTFAVWTGAVMKRLRSAYPATAVDFIHIAPAARAWAEQGGTLSYLFQPVALVPGSNALRTPMTTPQKR